MRISTLLDHITAIGFEVDEDWLARALTAALPSQQSAASQRNPL